MFYKDNPLRPPTPIDLQSYHSFRVVFNESVLNVQVDDFEKSFKVSEMKKVFGDGLLRFQAARGWMAISSLKVTDGDAQ